MADGCDSNRPVVVRKLVEVILGAVARPDHRALDSIADRERFYRQHIEPDRWLRVVVDFSEDPAWVVTAVVQDNDPRG